MVYLVFGFVVCVGIVAVWEVFRDSRPTPDSPTPQPGAPDYVSGFRQWRKSSWALPSMVFLASVILCFVDFTKETHFWIHSPKGPLLAIVPAPGELRLTLGSSDPTWKVETHTLLTDTGKRLAPKEVSASGMSTTYDIAAVPARLMISPLGLLHRPRLSRGLRQLRLPYWFLGLLAAGGIHGVRWLSKRASSESASSTSPS